MPIGAFELNNGVWVPVDIWESVGGQPLPVMDGHVLDAGEWKLAYQREQATVTELTSGQQIADRVAGTSQNLAPWLTENLWTQAGFGYAKGAPAPVKSGSTMLLKPPTSASVVIDNPDTPNVLHCVRVPLSTTNPHRVLAVLRVEPANPALRTFVSVGWQTSGRAIPSDGQTWESYILYTPPAAGDQFIGIELHVAPGYTWDDASTSTVVLERLEVLPESQAIPRIGGVVSDLRGENAVGRVELLGSFTGGADQLVSATELVDGEFWLTPSSVLDTPGTGMYRVRFPMQLPYLASQAETNTFAIKAGETQIAITSQPSGDILAGITPLGTYAGTVRRTSDSAPAAGTIKLQLVNDDNSLTLLSDSVAVAADGSWSYSHGTAGVLGPRRLLVEFTPSGTGFEASTQSGGTVNVVLGTPVLTKGSVSNTSFAASWTAVPGRTTTEAWVNGTLNLTNVGTSQTWQAGQYTEYALKVRAVGSTPGGAKVYSPFSTEYRCRTGRTEVRDTGAHQCYIHAVGSGSYRRDIGWGGTVGDKVRQGWYSTAYGGAGYFGLIDYGDRGIYNRLVQDLGPARADNCWVTNFYVGLNREHGVGAYNSDLYAEISASDAWIGYGADPVGQWEPRGFTARPVGAGFIWYGFDARFGEEFKTYKHRSVCIRYHAKANYLGFNGVSAGSADCDAQIRVEWNFVTVSGATGVWLN